MRIANPYIIIKKKKKNETTTAAAATATATATKMIVGGEGKAEGGNLNKEQNST